MSESFVIQWKSIVDGRAGKGTKIFNREEGEELIQELNSEYPEIVHELVVAPSVPGQPEGARITPPETNRVLPAEQEKAAAPELPRPAAARAFPE
jgi:hypothetical protein